MNVPFSPPDITEEEIQAVTDVLRSGWITTGPKTKELERQIADYCGTNKVVCLNSATACMEMTLRLFEIGPGDEIIVPAYTYTASASVIDHVGATIKMVDVAKDSFFIDYDAVEDAITERTKAIIPVDIAGVMVDYEKIRQIIERKKDLFKPASEMQRALGRILILGDAAHSYGAKRKIDNEWCMSGSVADFTSFSFHAVKNFTTAEGGAITWRSIPGIDDEEIYHKYMLLTLHGQSKDALAKTKIGSWEYDIVGTYYKFNMTDIMAAIGLIQQKRYSGMLERRKQLVDMYVKGIESDKIKLLQHYSDDSESSGHLMLVRVIGADEEIRNEIILKLAEQGIAANVHYKPLPMHTAYKKLGFKMEDFPNSFEMYRNEITLPLHTCLTDEQINYVIDTFNRIVKELV